MNLKDIDTKWLLYIIGGALLTSASLAPTVYTQALTTAGTLIVTASGVLGLQNVGQSISALMGKKA